jgi:hypothetical protein
LCSYQHLVISQYYFLYKFNVAFSNQTDYIAIIIGATTIFGAGTSLLSDYRDLLTLKYSSYQNTTKTLSDYTGKFIKQYCDTYVLNDKYDSREKSCEIIHQLHDVVIEDNIDKIMNLDATHLVLITRPDFLDIKLLSSPYNNYEYDKNPANIFGASAYQQPCLISRKSYMRCECHKITE